MKYDENQTYKVSRDLLTRCLLLTKGEMLTFLRRKLAAPSQPCGQRSYHQKWNRQTHVPPCVRCCAGHHISAVRFGSKVQNLNLIMKKQLTNPNLGAVFKITDPTLRKYQVPKNKAKLRDCSRLKNTEETSQLNLCDSGLDSGH